MKINKKYLIKMSDIHPELVCPKSLPRPTPKEFRCESLKELGIITVRCELNEI